MKSIVTQESHTHPISSTSPVTPPIVSKLNLTPRDYALLRRVGQVHVASLDQLHFLFWSQPEIASLKTSRNRLSQLVGEGYLECAYTNARKKTEKIYALTYKALQVVSPAEQAHMEAGLPRTNEMREALDAGEARIILELELKRRSEKLLSWKSEHEIRSEAFSERAIKEHELGRRFNEEELAALPELPDARLYIQSADGTYIYQLDLEIDGAYYNQMLKRKVAGLHANSLATGRKVIWVTATHRRGQRIQKEIQLTGADKTIEVMVLEGNLPYVSPK
jgi:hypothetical protein